MKDEGKTSKQLITELEKEFILDSQLEHVIYQDREHRILWPNLAACQSVEAEREELIGRYCYEIWPKHSERCEDCPVALAMKTGQQQESEQTTPDGRTWFIRGSPVRDASGQIVGAIEVTQEITQRVRYEETLRQRAEELDALQETVLDITTQHDLSTLLETIVERAVRLLSGTGGGMYLCDPEQETVRCEVSYNTPHDFTGTVLRYGEGAAGAVAQTGEPLIIDDYRSWSGRAEAYEEEQPFSAVLSTPMMWQGQVMGVIHVLDDVESRRFTQADLKLLTAFANHASIAAHNAQLYQATQQELDERAQAEKALRQSEERFRKIFEEGPLGMGILSLDGRFISANPTLCQIVGYTEEELAELTFLDITHPDDVDPSCQLAGDLLTGAVPYIQTEKRFVTKDGHTQWVNLTVTLIHDAEGNPLSKLTMIEDIGERKGAEEALRKERDRAMALEEAAAVVSSTLDPDQVLDRILEQLTRVVSYDATNIMLVEDDQARIVRWRGYEHFGEEELLASLTYHVPDAPLLQQMTETRRPLVAPDTATYPGWVRKPPTGWVCSYASAPIVVRGEVIGFLNVDSASPGFFNQTHADTLRAFADHAAVAIQNARLFEAEQERRQIEQTLRQASTVLNSTLELDQVLELILEQLHQVIPYDTASVQQLHGKGLKIAACRGFEEASKVVGLVFPLDPKFPNHQVVTSKAPLPVDDISHQYPHFEEEADTYASGHILSWLGVPLMVKDQVIGMIALDRVTLHPYSAEEAQLAVAFANQAAIAIENARLFAETERYRAFNESIVQTVPGGILVTDAEGYFTFTNPAAVELLGYTPEELLSQHWSVIFPPDQQPIVKAADERRVRGELDRYEAELMRKDGTRVPTLISGSPWFETGTGRFTGTLSVLADITQRVRAEQALRESEERYRQSVENSPNPIFSISQEGIVQTWNRACEQMFQYQPEEIIGQTYHQLLWDAEDRPLVDGMVAQVLQKRPQEDLDLRYRCKDGTQCFTASRLYPLMDREGNTEGCVFANTDISERVQAEEALRQSERLFHTLIDSLPQNVFSKDLEGRFVFANQSYCTTEGKSLEDILGKTDFDLYPPELARKYREDDRRVIETGDILETVEEHRPVEGGSFYVQVVKAPVYDSKGQTTGILGIFWDITKRRRAEQLLQALNQTAQAMDKALTPEEIFTAMAEEFSKLGLNYVVFLTDENQSRLYPKYLNHSSAAIKAAEKLAGIRTEDYFISVEAVDLYRQVVWNRKTVFLDNVEEAMRQVLPGPARRFAKQFVKMLKMPRFIASPLMVEDQVIGVLTVQSDDVAEDDVPAMTAFSHQVAAAWHKAKLYEQAQQEISERMQAEEEIKRLKEFNEGIVQSMVEGITMEDSQGHFTFVNPAAAALLGYTPQELIGQHWTTIMPPDQQPIVKTANKRRRCGESDQYDLELIRRDGTRVPVLISGSPHFEDGEFAGTLAVFTDITERVEAEREIRRRNRGLTLLNQIIAASASDLDPETMLETACRELARTFDVPQAAAALINEEKTEAVVVAEYVAEGHTPARGEIIPVKDNASYQYLLSNKAPLVVQDAQSDPRLEPIHDLMCRRGTVSLLILPLMVKGEVIGSLGLDAVELGHFSAEDVSLAWSAADQVAGALARARLNEQRERLEEQYRQAQKMEAVGRLTAGIAHDFNNLLTAINGFAELTRHELLPDDPLHEMVEKILHSGRRAADLVRQLLAFSRKQIIEPQVLDLNAVVADMEKMLRRIIGEDIELRTSPAPDLWPVKVDPTQIGQVVANLAVNARDAMPDGGQLIIETANVVLDTEGVADHLETQPGEYVMLSVSDTGVGMSDEVKDHLFEPFFTTKEPGKGTGLGLATVYGVIKQSGGDIRVHSQEDEGTTFRIYLPRVTEITPAPVRSRGMADVPSGDETILLVEDDESVRDLTWRVLEGQGYTVLQAGNGQEAIQVAASHAGRIHLMVTDLVMPGMSGKALAEQLSQVRPDIKVLFISGYTDELIAEYGILEPGVTLLQKPFRPVELAHKVRQVLDVSQPS